MLFGSNISALLLDKNNIEKLGAFGTSFLVMFTSKNASAAHTSYIHNYLFFQAISVFVLVALFVLHLCYNFMCQITLALFIACIYFFKVTSDEY
jgi:hypothetical protein